MITLVDKRLIVEYDEEFNILCITFIGNKRELQLTYFCDSLTLIQDKLYCTYNFIFGKCSATMTYRFDDVSEIREKYNLHTAATHQHSYTMNYIAEI